MINEESKQHWMRLGIVAIVIFLIAYLAFYLAMKHNIRKLTNPLYQAEHIEKIMEKQMRDFDKMENPFEPKMRPMIVNLVKETDEYKVIIDLAQLDGNQDAINVSVQGDELTVKGEIDKKLRGTEKIINFTQTYYLDEKLDENKITKERKGNKYIVTIPFKTEENDN